MKTLLRSILATIVSLALLAWFIPQISILNTVTLIAAGIVLTLLEFTLRPLLKLLFLPINIITLGLFGWLINVFVLWLVTVLVPGFQIGEIVLLGFRLSEFWSLVAVAFLMSFIGGWIRALLG